MEEKKIRFKDLSGWLKFGIVGGIIYILIITLGLIAGLIIGFMTPIQKELNSSNPRCKG